MIFATRVQLGYDPTIDASLCIDGRKLFNIQVRYEDDDNQVQCTSFRTDELIAGISAEAIRGRATRVWSGRELNDDRKPTGNTIVIKDVWIDTNRTREGDILAELRRDAIASGNDQLIKNCETSFLHVRCHGDVWVEGRQTPP